MLTRHQMKIRFCPKDIWSGALRQLIFHQMKRLQNFAQFPIFFQTLQSDHFLKHMNIKHPILSQELRATVNIFKSIIQAFVWVFHCHGDSSESLLNSFPNIEIHFIFYLDTKISNEEKMMNISQSSFYSLLKFLKFFLSYL